MEPDLCKLVAVKYGDVGETLRRYLADNDAEFAKFLRSVRDFLVASVDAKRKTDVNAIVIDTYTVYAKLYDIQNAAERVNAYDDYAAPLAGALPRVVAYSFAAEYRKLQVLFGLAGALADLLVFEMRIFGCHVDCYGADRPPCACRGVRRAIGNALANLTYRQRECKLALCAHTVFLECLTDVIANVPYLAQYYAGLIRNLSWNTDETFAREALAGTVPALAHAAVIARDVKCRLAVLSALWNLAPHSAHNRRAMCARRDFLAMLADQLDDLRQQAMLESASGVFKYLCGYVREDEALRHFVVVDLRLVGRLLRLLQAPSFTAVVNALGALGVLAAHDDTLCDALARDANAMRVIGHLRETNREDVSAGAKTLQDLIFEAPPLRSSHDRHTAASATMTRSHTVVPPDPIPYYNNSQTLGADYHNRTRVRRPIVADCNDGTGTLRPAEAQAASRYGTMMTGCDYGENSTPADIIEGFNQNSDTSLTAVGELESAENNVDELTDSMQCTASVSMESLNSIEHNDEWPSTITTASNSGTQSPASGSELPDSPSHCSAALFAFDNFRLTGGSPHDGGTSSSHTLSVAEKKSLSSGAGQTNHNNHGLSTDAVDNGVDERLLNDMVNSVLPKKPNNQHHPRPYISDDDGLLDECIASVMPRRPTLTVATHAALTADSADGTIDWDDSTHFPGDESEAPFWNGHVPRLTMASAAITSVIRAQDSEEESQLFKALKKSSLLENRRTSETIRDAEQLRRLEPEPVALVDSTMTGSSSSEGDNYNFIAASRVTADFPVDIDEQFQRQASLTVDCEEYSERISGGKLSTSSYTSSPTKLKMPSTILRKPVTSTQRSPQPPTKPSATVSPRVSQATSVNRNKTRPPVAPKPKWTMSNKSAMNGN